jgi:hypothetical protein
MTGFKALDEVFSTTLDLPGRDGKIWRIPEGDSEVGLWCVRVFEAASAVANGQEPDTGSPPPQLTFEGAEETSLQIRLLSRPIYDALIAEGYGLATLNFFTQTVIMWHAAGREVAELFWNAGGRPEDFLPAANRAARRQRATSTSTAAAATTKHRASTTGTTSRPTAKRQ